MMLEFGDISSGDLRGRKFVSCYKKIMVESVRIEINANGVASIYQITETPNSDELRQIADKLDELNKEQK